ncbi:ABC transporter ATP-binding protein [Leucobacter aridicollis]|uniref:ABC transporter ATP-binding protein n=1 Tax=Leucobacter aridicollis TaxID=283878 RepID=UPI002104C7D5|nr:ABC transporter ATP-binding protein [Leucobacter aridicollis]UTX52414.1 ABC transporter ATP-binding protein [Leucobacter aridicollis]
MIPAPSVLQPLELTEFGAIRGSASLSDPLSLRLEPGTVLGIVGPNGVGKSSLLGAIAHSGVTSYGRAVFGGEDLGRLRPKRRAQVVSLMAQDHGAPGELRVNELVAVGAWASGREDPAEAVAAALTRAGISNLADRRYGTLSGGQRQLVQLARVLAQNTPIVVMDEPTSALDLAHQRAVEQIMRGLGNQGRIVIAAIHDLSLALNTCTRVLLLDPGGASHSGPPHEVLGPDRVFAAYGVRTTIHTTPQGRRILAADD